MFRTLVSAVLALAGCGSPQTTAASRPATAGPSPATTESSPAENPTPGRTAAAPRCDAKGARPERKTQLVLLVTQDNLYLEGALLVIPNVEVKKVTPRDYDLDPRIAGEMDAVIFNDYTPRALPPARAGLLFFHPTGPNSPFAISHHVDAPRITGVDDAHPVLRSVTMSDVNIEKSDVFLPDARRGQSAIADANGHALIVASHDDDRKIVAVGFSLTATDLPLRVAFPILLSNSLEWFASGCVPEGPAASRE